MLKDKNGNIIQNHGKDQDTIIQNGIEYDYTYSPNGFVIERDGIPYVDATDPLGSNRVYIETDIPIEPAEEAETDETEDYAEDRILVPPYMTGEKMRYIDGKIYESLMDNNVWSPEEYPAGWKSISE